MRYLVINLLVGVLAVGAYAAHIPYKPAYEIRTVVIDAGHGGKDGGCQGGSAIEKNIVLQVALQLGGLIQSHFPNIEVVYTRDNDVFVPLQERANIANQRKADLFISIHANALPGTNSSGAETYVIGMHDNDEALEVAIRENESILLEDSYKLSYGDFDPTSPLSYIALAHYQSAYQEQSIALAQMIQKELGVVASRKNRGVKQANFCVLRTTAMPSVLVEIGYLTHAAERDYLQSETGISNVAYALFNAFSSYKQSVESSSGGGVYQVAIASESTLPQPTPATVHEAHVLAQPAPPLTTTASAVVLSTTPKMLETIQSSSSPPPPIVYNEVEFKVQIAASAVSFEEMGKGTPAIDNLHVEYIDGYYKYVVGGFGSDLNSCKKQCAQLAKTYKSAFVVGYVNGIRVSVAEARGALPPK